MEQRGIQRELEELQQYGRSADAPEDPAEPAAAAVAAEEAAAGAAPPPPPSLPPLLSSSRGCLGPEVVAGLEARLCAINRRLEGFSHQVWLSEHCSHSLLSPP